MFAWGLVQRKIIGLVRACLGVGLHRFSSVSDAKFPDVCPMEQSNNTLKHSWHSRKIREFERYNETLCLEVMMVEQKLEVITEL
ncbi:hypothetical protein GQ55_3G358000 [Panicum hallii var. hallii]|uniref:Uncharacterized protein n=1 Tax=Panicum hallii var. hallii TaxID=1504633 RepID=A0A2T7EFZ4_9POAL|nr:hypothetical protein GQ55_3G358000 [Panicum hallii var. hallii]